MVLRVVILCAFGAIFFSSCLSKKSWQRDQKKRITIEFIENPYVVASLSSLFYEDLYSYFSRMGYCLHAKESCDKLRVSLCKAAFVYKYISSDILLFHIETSLSCECDIVSHDGTSRQKKIFTEKVLVSRSSDPVLRESFEHFAYKRILKKMIPKIERYYWSYFLNMKHNHASC